MAYIKLFKASDDSQITEFPSGDPANPVEFILRADLDEIGEWQRLYALADDGYVIGPVPPADEIAISIIDTTHVTKWQLCPDDEGSPDEGAAEAWGDPLDIGAEVNDTDKVYFWVRAKAVNTETPVNDLSVGLKVEGVASAE